MDSLGLPSFTMDDDMEMDNVAMMDNAAMMDNGGMNLINDSDSSWVPQDTVDVPVMVAPPKNELPPPPQARPAQFPALQKEQHSGFKADTAARAQTRTGFFDAMFAMNIFRCWHIILFYAAWAALITYLYQGRDLKFLAIPDAMLKIAGTALGFVVSWRSAQSFARYNEGRKQWSAIVSTTRTFARLVWFNVPNTMPQYADMDLDEQKARALMEKKTVLNLVEAFAVATKHYLRSEDGIYYTDLYHLVKFLPAYSMPAGILEDSSQHGMIVNDPGSPTREAQRQRAAQAQGLPQPVTVRQRAPVPNTLTPDFNPNMLPPMPSPLYSAARPTFAQQQSQGLKNAELLSREDEVYLIPAYKPPRWAILQIWPFSLLRGKRIVPASKATGDRAKKIRAKVLNKADSHNLPLEISLYLGSWIAAHQRRGTNPVVINNLANNVNQLVAALTSLERILTTPIPWSYHIHLWVLLCGYVLLLPFQVVKGMGWYTIPGVTLFAAVFFGFLTGAEELEDPFGYGKNDLNLDHFTHNIIRAELMAITSAPAPDPAVWAFSPENNLIFTGSGDTGPIRGERVSPDEWIRRGSGRIQHALRR